MVGDPDLLLPLDEELDVDRQAAVGRQQCRDRLDLGEELALVVGGAARVEAAVAHGRLERRRCPLLQRLGRLHVVVAVHGTVGASAPAPSHSPYTAGWPPSAARTSVSSPAASISPARCSAERRTSPARSGSLEIEGMAHHSDSSRTSASASACTKASMSATGSPGKRAEVDQTATGGYQRAPALVGSLPVRPVGPILLECCRRCGSAWSGRARSRPATCGPCWPWTGSRWPRSPTRPWSGPRSWPPRPGRPPTPTTWSCWRPSAWTPSTSASRRSLTARSSWP